MWTSWVKGRAKGALGGVESISSEDTFKKDYLTRQLYGRKSKCALIVICRVLCKRYWSENDDGGFGGLSS